MANQKVSAFQVMKVMGHTSLDIVLQYYHSTDEELLAAVSGLPFDKMITDGATVGPENKETKK